MSPAVNPRKRRYDAPRRAAAAALTRTAILAAAKDGFERRGWSGTTVPSIAEAAGVSPKTVEALFGTKAALLTVVVDYAIRGDADDVPIVRKEQALAIEQEPRPAAMLDLHAGMVAAINERSAQIAWVVESAAPGDERVAPVWERMMSNLGDGARWAAETLLAKRGVRADLTLSEAEETFLVAMEWGTYRTLARSQAAGRDAFEAWVRRYYGRMLLGGRR